MRAEKINWDRPTLAKYRSPAMDDVLRFCERLTGLFAKSRVPMPILVFNLPADQATDSRVSRLTGILGAVADLHAEGKLLCERFPRQDGQDDPESPLPSVSGDLRNYSDAIGLARALATPRTWTNWDKSQYRPYSFPRSQMLAAIEEAVAKEAAENGTRLTCAAVLTRLGKLNWRPAKPGKKPWRQVLSSVFNPATLLGAGVLAVYARFVAAASLTGVLISIAAWILTIGLGLIVQQNVAPLSWLGSANWWFVTTTFMNFMGAAPSVKGIRLGWLRLRPRRAWRILEVRGARVIRMLITAYYPPAEEPSPTAGNDTEVPDTPESALALYLELRVHALLMDLRGNYSRWFPDLRHWKRTCPPMVFLPDVDQEPGGVELLQAISDLRSRRSEVDPMLIVAGSRSPHTWRHTSAARLESGLSHWQADLYEQWVYRLQVEQSPSLGSRLPWVLLYPIATELLEGATGGWQDLPRAPRTPWNLWSRWTLLPAVGLLTALIVLSSVLSGKPSTPVTPHCGRHVTMTWVGDECIGVDTTDTIEFVPSGGGVTLSGAVSKAQAGPGVGADINLADLERLVVKQNASALAAPSHVTFVYAGALTAHQATPLDPLSAAEELAGVYAWQAHINSSSDPVKIRIDIANDGDGSAHELVMADEIAAAASQDPTIVGVIGLGVDTQQTAVAVQELAVADLPVIGTTNSDVSLPGAWNYFGLSPTNKEEPQALLRYVPHTANRWAIIFERVTDTDGAPDPYTIQQGNAAETALKEAGFHLAGGTAITYTPGTVLSNIDTLGTAICAEQPSVVYLAGRHQDLEDLITLLNQEQQCFPAGVTVLSGDDMTAVEYPDVTSPPLAHGMTLYYVAQTAPAYVGPGDLDDYSGLALDFANAFSLGNNNIPSYTASPFADGLLSLGFDAADALYSASTKDAGASRNQVPLPRAAVTPTLRCLPSIDNGATGHIGFANVGHGMDIFEAANTPDNNHQKVTHLVHIPTVPRTCAPNVAT